MEFSQTLLHEWKKESGVIQVTIASGGTLSVVGIYEIGKSLLFEYLKSNTQHTVVISLKDLPNPSVQDLYQIVASQLITRGLVSSRQSVPEISLYASECCHKPRTFILSYPGSTNHDEFAGKLF